MTLPKPSSDKRQALHHAQSQYRIRRYRHELQQLFWECTLRCNLHCLHCGSDCRTVSETKDMPLEDFLPVLDDVRTVMDPRRILVITTGGEPLVRPDICECGKAIRERGFHWGMVSNGMLLDERMCNRLMESGLETIAISMDGFEQDHNWLRENPESFASAENAVKNLVDKNITWDVITCVHQKNLGYLPEFKRYLLSIGVRQWRLFCIAPMGRAAHHPELQLHRKQFREMLEFIADTRKTGDMQVSYSCEGFLGGFELEVRDYPFFCQSGINVASILTDGAISGCLSIRSNFHQGNIYKDKFSEVWASRFENMRNREWMHTGACAECDVWQYCQGNGMHLRDEDGKLMRCHYLAILPTSNTLYPALFTLL